MEYIILSFAIFTIFYSTLSLALVRTLKAHHGAIRGHNVAVEIAENTHCRACNVLLIDHNHGCVFERPTKPLDVLQDTTSDISATIADVENYLLADYERYRDTLLELKALPPGITHTDGNTDNNAVENLKLAERKPVDYELATSGLEAGSIVAYNQSLTWTDNIKIWQQRETTIYPDGYEQGIVILQDDKPILKSTWLDRKHDFKKLIKFEKVKKTRKSKIGVC